jgi:hypothetical protein
MMRRLTRRRQVKKKSKHSRNNKYKKTRCAKYIKKRRSITRRRELRGGEDIVDIQGITDAIDNGEKNRFSLLVDGLEINPTILKNIDLQNAYKKMIELSKSRVLTGYLGLPGLKFLNYLWSRVKLLNQETENYKNLQTAISLMDQLALAPGITKEQLGVIQKLAPNQDYYKCYYKLFNDLRTMMSVKKRNIPVSSSACYMNDQCGTGNDSCDSDGGCCSPTGLPTT